MNDSPQLDAQQRRWAESAMSCVAPLARRVHYAGCNLSHEDLESHGNEALVKAALRYDPSLGVPFASFAYYRVRGAMVDALRSRNRAGRQARRAEKKLEASQAVLETAAAQGVADTATLRERVEAARKLVEKTTAAAIVSRGCDKPVESIQSGHTGAEDQLLSQELRAMVREVIDELDDDARALVTSLYIEGEQMQVFAKRVGKSLSTISRRHSKLLGVLATRLRAKGIDP